MPRIRSQYVERVAFAITFAITQPNDVDRNETLFRPTHREL